MIRGKQLLDESGHMQVSNQGLPLRVRSKSRPFLQARLKASVPQMRLHTTTPMGSHSEKTPGSRVNSLSNRTSRTFTFAVLQI
jgi:hypothetical protein